MFGHSSTRTRKLFKAAAVLAVALFAAGLTFNGAAFAAADNLSVIGGDGGDGTTTGGTGAGGGDSTKTVGSGTPVILARGVVPADLDINGGNGGDVSSQNGGKLSGVYGDITLMTSFGGDGADGGGDGGRGGVLVLTGSSGFTAQGALNIETGVGGDGGNGVSGVFGGAGGNGGSIGFSGAITVDGVTHITTGYGGQGGQASDSTDPGGAGGNGGDIAIIANVTSTLDADAAFVVEAGNGGDGTDALVNGTLQGFAGNGGDIGLGGAYNLAGQFLSAAGNGGNAGTAISTGTGGTDGGLGGDLLLDGTFTSTRIGSVAASDFEVYAGDGGDGFAGDDVTTNLAGAGDGGDGGSASLSGVFNMAGTVHLASGDGGDGGTGTYGATFGGDGGDLFLNNAKFKFNDNDSASVSLYELYIEKGADGAGGALAGAAGYAGGTIRSLEVVGDELGFAYDLAGAANSGEKLSIHTLKLTNNGTAAGFIMYIGSGDGDTVYDGTASYDSSTGIYTTADGALGIINYEVTGLGNTVSSNLGGTTFVIGANNSFKATVDASDFASPVAPLEPLYGASALRPGAGDFIDISGLAVTDSDAIDFRVTNLGNLWDKNDANVFVGLNLIDTGTDGTGGLPGDMRGQHQTHGLANYWFGLAEVDPTSGQGNHAVALTYLGSDIITVKPYWEAWLAGMVTLNEGYRTTEKARWRSVNETGLDRTSVVFEFGGSYIENETGSKVDVDTYAVNLTVAHKFETSFSHLTAGAFFEAGWGSYDTSNSFNFYGRADGDGDTDYYGGGLFVNNAFTGLPGLYVEAALRFGIVSNDYDVDYNGDSMNYDTDTNYWGTTATLGYLWDISEQDQLDLYGKFLWTHMDDDTTTTSHDEKLKFDSVDSRRTRLGGRYTHDFGSGVKTYVGAAWEHEFDGEADGNYRGRELDDEPSLEGSSGLGEVGVIWTPSENTPLSVNLSGYGMVGQNEGGGFNIGLKYEF